MHTNFEYVFAGFIIILVLTSTQIYSTNLLNRKIADWEQSAGYQKADSFLDMLLLSPGEPSNWCDLPGNPGHIGLSSTNSFEEYTLDARKVERLTLNSSQYISPGVLRSLLGFSSTIGFSLRIVPALNLNISYLGPGQYVATVMDQKGLLVPNINVTAYYVPMPFNPYEDPTILRSVTGIWGNCSLSTPKTSGALVVCVGESGILDIGTYPSSIPLTVQGNHVMSTTNPTVLAVNSTTGTFYGQSSDVASKYVKIDGYTYYAELIVWS
jgi:hypothetical protein